MDAEAASFQSYLDRRRNLLFAAGDPRPLYRDLDLHLLSIGVRQGPATLRLLRDGLSALALYAVSRPRFESFGWTVSLQDPPLNLFFTGSGREGCVVGRAFHHDVQPAPANRFFAQTVRPHGEPQTSSVEVEGSDLFGFVEQYCRKSDQQLVRLFRRGEGRAGLLMPLPDADRGWFEAASAAEVFALEGSGELKLLAEHPIAFRCGCDLDKLTRALTALFREDPEELFQGESEVEAECPRCGAKYRVPRELFDGAGRVGRQT